MDQTAEPVGAFGPHDVERLRRGRSDRDVIGMPRDPIRSERDDDVGAFIAKDRRDAFDELIERDVGQPVVGVAQPFVAIGAPAQGDPRPAILLLTDRAERLARGERRIGDHAGLTARGMDEDEPERRILRVQRDGSRHTERVVVGMGEDRGEPRAHSCSSRASNPTVRPGRDATAFTAITTPGMNEVQSVES